MIMALLIMMILRKWVFISSVIMLMGICRSHERIWLRAIILMMYSWTLLTAEYFVCDKPLKMEGY